MNDGRSRRLQCKLPCVNTHICIALRVYSYALHIADSICMIHYRHACLMAYRKKMETLLLCYKLRMLQPYDMK